MITNHTLNFIIIQIITLIRLWLKTRLLNSKINI